MLKKTITNYALNKVMSQDLVKNIKALISSSLEEQFDMVSKEEFELQSKLLADTRMELDRLKERLEALENKQ
jgi:BMFP domain-containing protein YqiC